LVGGAQVLGGLAGCGCLLGVLLLRVPVGGGGDEEEQHVDHHRGGGPVFPAAERRPAVDEVAGGLAQGPVVAVLGFDVGAGGPLEHEGRLAQFGRVWAAEVLASASRTSPAAAMCAATWPSSPLSMTSTACHTAVLRRRARRRGGCRGFGRAVPSLRSAASLSPDQRLRMRGRDRSGARVEPA
jgi:hypothetical protein